jgi:hypothetical protein
MRTNYVPSLKRDIYHFLLQIQSALERRAAINSFCLEVQRQLDMGYAAPYGEPPPPMGFNANESLEKSAPPETTIEKNRERTASDSFYLELQRQLDMDYVASLEKNAQPETIEKNRERTASTPSTDSISSMDQGIMANAGLFETKKRK